MTDQERINLLLLKAEESVRGARVLLSENMPDFSVSRAYYREGRGDAVGQP